MILTIVLPIGKFKVEDTIEIGQTHILGGSLVECPTGITFNDNIMDLPTIYTVKNDMFTFTTDI